MKWKIIGTTENVLTLELRGANKDTWHFLLVSDVHLDSIHCDRETFFEHLRRAKEMGAGVLINGDLFDAMQGRADPRRSMDELREEYRRDDYYDYVVRDTARLLAPYAKNIILIARGNHETKVRKYQGIDLVEWLVYVLRNEYGSQVVSGGYAGWIRFHVRRKDGRPVRTVVMRYAHGAGGGNAPVTRGVIQTNRQAVYLPEADVVWNGHNHQAYVLPIARERLSLKGTPQRVLTWFVRTSGYKDEFTGKDMGYAVEKGRGPTPVGSALLTISLRRLGDGKQWDVYTKVELWAE